MKVVSTEYDSDNNIVGILWYLKGQQHREDGPAITSYFPDGIINFEEYWLDGIHYSEPEWRKIIKIMNATASSMSYYNENGSIRRIEHYLNGILHREDGPAYIRYNDLGKVKYEKWFLNGQLINKVVSNEN